MNDERDANERDGGSPASNAVQNDVRAARRPYLAPELIEYGTVAKLTQTGGGSVKDFGNMMTMAGL